jgi:curved DNA-binding protein CbpA
MPAPNHYEVLGLPVTATPQEVESRYRDLARLYEIDSGVSGTGMGSLIAESYRVLSNPALRAAYDSAIPAAAPIPELDKTQEVPPPLRTAAPNPAMERTVEVPHLRQQNRPVADDADKALAAELARRGIPPDEVRRLVALGKQQDSDKPGASAARITADALPPSTPYVPRPTISLPEPRESSAQERADADRTLTAANIARRRSNFREAETLCRQAVELVPGDAAALELYGDILQSTGRVDDAVLAYKRATEIDPARRSAEKKYGDLVLRQDRSIFMIRDEYVPGNANVAVLLSAVFPGAGQVYNGESLKGLAVVLAFLAMLYVIFYTRFGLPHAREGIPTSLGISIAIAGIIYIYGVVDANLIARRGRRRGTGWEV